MIRYIRLNQRTHFIFLSYLSDIKFLNTSNIFTSHAASNHRLMKCRPHIAEAIAVTIINRLFWQNTKLYTDTRKANSQII